MLAVAAAGFTLLLAAAEAIQWSASAETQSRVRSEPNAGAHDALGEADFRARLGLVALGTDGAATLVYSPRFLLRQEFSGPPTTGTAVQQGGQLQLESRLAPDTALRERTSLEWGRTDYSPLSGIPMSTFVRLPSQRFVRTLSIETLLDLTHAFSRRLRASIGAGFQRTGGLGHDGVELIPIQVGPKANASVVWDVDRTDTLNVAASAAESRFSGDRDTTLIAALGAWRHRSSRQITFEAGAGGALLRSAGTQLEPYPAGTLGAEWQGALGPSREVRASIHGRLSPAIDPFTTLATQTVRAEANGELIDGGLRIALAGTNGRVIQGVGSGTSDLRLGARASWRATAAWTVDGGVGAAWTNQAPFAGWQSELFIGFRWADTGAF